MNTRVQARSQQPPTMARHAPAPAPMQGLTPEQLRAVVGGADLPKTGQPDGTVE